MTLNHLGCNDVDRDAPTPCIRAQNFERGVYRESALHGDDPLCLFDENTRVECRLQLTNDVVAVTLHDGSLLSG